MIVSKAPLALGTTLVIAGIYQFTPLKRMCLRQCQSPMGFLITRWRDSSIGALRMGWTTGSSALAAAGHSSPCWWRLA